MKQTQEGLRVPAMNGRRHGGRGGIPLARRRHDRGEERARGMCVRVADPGACFSAEADHRPSRADELISIAGQFRTWSRLITSLRMCGQTTFRFCHQSSKQSNSGVWLHPIRCRARAKVVKAGTMSAPATDSGLVGRARLDRGVPGAGAKISGLAGRQCQNRSFFGIPRKRLK